MALFKCPECGNMISDKADKCPSCGYPITAKEEEQLREEPNEVKRKGKHKLIFIIPAILVVIMLLIS